MDNLTQEERDDIEQRLYSLIHHSHNDESDQIVPNDLEMPRNVSYRPLRYFLRKKNPSARTKEENVKLVSVENESLKQIQTPNTSNISSCSQNPQTTNALKHSLLTKLFGSRKYRKLEKRAKELELKANQNRSTDKDRKDLRAIRRQMANRRKNIVKRQPQPQPVRRLVEKNVKSEPSEKSSVNSHTIILSDSEDESHEIKKENEKSNSDDDVLIVETVPQKVVIEIEDSNATIASRNDENTNERSELLSTPESSLNDFLDKLSNTPNSHRFNFGLHGSEFKDSEFLRPSVPIDINSESGSISSISDVSTVKPNVFGLVDFPKEKNSVFDETQFENSITPQRKTGVKNNKNLPTLSDIQTDDRRVRGRSIIRELVNDRAYVLLSSSQKKAKKKRKKSRDEDEIVDGKTSPDPIKKKKKKKRKDDDSYCEFSENPEENLAATSTPSEVPEVESRKKKKADTLLTVRTDLFPNESEAEVEPEVKKHKKKLDSEPETIKKIKKNKTVQDETENSEEPVKKRKKEKSISETDEKIVDENKKKKKKRVFDENEAPPEVPKEPSEETNSDSTSEKAEENENIVQIKQEISAPVEETPQEIPTALTPLTTEETQTTISQCGESTENTLSAPPKEVPTPSKTSVWSRLGSPIPQSVFSQCSSKFFASSQSLFTSKDSPIPENPASSNCSFVISNVCTTTVSEISKESNVENCSETVKIESVEESNSQEKSTENNIEKDASVKIEKDAGSLDQEPEKETENVQQVHETVQSEEQAVVKTEKEPTKSDTLPDFIEQMAKEKDNINGVRKLFEFLEEVKDPQDVLKKVAMIKQAFSNEKVSKEDENNDVEIVEEIDDVLSVSSESSSILFVDNEKHNISEDITLANTNDNSENSESLNNTSETLTNNSQSNINNPPALESLNESYEKSLDKYEVEDVLNTMRDDPALWTICREDEPQYRPHEKRKRCVKCLEFGHLSHNCRNKRTLPKCLLCGNGHMDFKCPNKICTQCGRQSSIMQNVCQHCKHYQDLTCSICSMKGHPRFKCPDLWRRYHLTVEPGAIVVPDNRRLKPKEQLWCSFCAKSGHLEHYCYHSKKRNNFRQIDPRIHNYVDVYTTPEPLMSNAAQRMIDNFERNNLASTSNDAHNPDVVQNVEKDMSGIFEEAQLPPDFIVIDEVSNTPERRRNSFNETQTTNEELNDGQRNNVIEVERVDAEKLFRNNDVFVIRDVLRRELDSLDNMKFRVKDYVYRFHAYEKDDMLPLPQRTIPDEKKWKFYKALNMLCFGKQGFKAGNVHLRKLRNFVNSTKINLTQPEKQSTFFSYDYIFREAKHDFVNYSLFLKLMLNKYGKQTI